MKHLFSFLIIVQLFIANEILAAAVAGSSSPMEGSVTGLDEEAVKDDDLMRDIHFLWVYLGKNYKDYLKKPETEDVEDAFFIKGDDGLYKPIYDKKLLLKIINDTFKILIRTEVVTKSKKINFDDFEILTQVYYQAGKIRSDPANALISMVRIFAMLKLSLGEMEEFEQFAMSWARMPNYMQDIIVALLKTQFDSSHLRNDGADSEKNAIILSYLVPTIEEDMSTEATEALVVDRVTKIIDLKLPEKPKLLDSREYQGAAIEQLEKVIAAPVRKTLPYGVIGQIQRRLGIR